MRCLFRGVVFVATLTAATGTAVAAAAGQPVLVVHLHEYEPIRPEELLAATRTVSEAFAAVGVRLVWATGHARLAPADGCFHADVVILNESLSRADGSRATEFGKANAQMRRATIYYPRIRAHAGTTGSRPARLLALVLTHELGHLVLGEGSHARSGVMGPRWRGRIVFVPGFTKDESTKIRERLQTWIQN